MKPPADETIRHGVASKRVGDGVEIPRRLHRGLLKAADKVPAVLKAIGSGASAIGAVLAVFSVASCAF